MAHLKVLCILRCNLGSDIKVHEVQSNITVLTEVLTIHCYSFNFDTRKIGRLIGQRYVLTL